MAALCIDANSDEDTRPLFIYRKARLYPELEQSLTLVALSGAGATREKVAAEAKGPNVRLITGSGHGTATAFNGAHSRALFVVGGFDPREVGGKIVHLLACQTGLQLGPDLVANGCDAFFGYDVDFAFSPFSDLAELFFDADSEIDRRLASGKTAAEAYAAAVARFDEHIDEVEERAAKEVNPARKDVLLWTAATLEFNRDHLLGPRQAGSPMGRPDATL